MSVSPGPTNHDLLAVLNERLNAIRSEQGKILTKLDAIYQQLGDIREFRSATERDISQLRQDVQTALLRHAELGRTVGGLGKSFDDYKDAEAIKAARLHGQLVLLRWISGVGTGTAGLIVGRYALQWLGL